MLKDTYQKLNSVQTFTVSLNDMTFERVYKFKYLGVTLDPNLSWYDHIDVIGNKISSQKSWPADNFKKYKRKRIPKKKAIF